MKPSEQPPAWATSVLLVDGNHTERAFYAEGLKQCSPDYQILEVADRQSGLDVYRRSYGIECVVLELALPDMSGFRLLPDFIVIPSRPTVAVVVLTNRVYQGLWELAKEHGAYACLLKQHTLGAELDKAVHRAIACVGQLPKEDRHRPTILL
jgi:CheY-like chemotaxis protein